MDRELGLAVAHLADPIRGPPQPLGHGLVFAQPRLGQIQESGIRIGDDRLASGQTAGASRNRKFPLDSALEIEIESTPVTVNITPTRHMPGWLLVRRLKRAGLSQWDIARRAGTSQQTVSSTIHRRNTKTEKTEAVWRELDRALNGVAAEDGRRRAVNATAS